MPGRQLELPIRGARLGPLLLPGVLSDKFVSTAVAAPGLLCCPIMLLSGSPAVNQTRRIASGATCTPDFFTYR
jgi:hypothetical protein